MSVKYISARSASKNLSLISSLACTPSSACCLRGSCSFSAKLMMWCSARGCHPELCVKICSKQGGKETRAEQKTGSKRKKLLCEQRLSLRNEEQRKKNHPPDDNSTRSKHKTTSREHFLTQKSRV